MIWIYRTIEYDTLGCIVALADASGNVVESYKYSPWGDPTIYSASGEVLPESAVENPYLFTSREVDILDSGSLKIQKNRHRDYHYNLAIWMQADPLGVAPNSYMNRFNPHGQYKDGLNIYQYVGGQPVSRVDALGLAYFALRPLAGMPWFWGASNNALDDSLNTEVSHEQVFIRDGKKPSNFGFFAQGEDDNGNIIPEGVHPDQAKYIGLYRITKSGYNNCVIRIAVSRVKPKPYSLLGIGSKVKYNCQDWAEEVRSVYTKLVKDAKVKCLCNVKASEIK